MKRLVYRVDKNRKLCGLSYEEIFYGICLLGAALQIAWVLKRFFDFEYLTRAHVNIPDQSGFPDISLCFAITDIINYTKLFKEHPAIARSLGYSEDVIVTDQVDREIRARFSANDLMLLLMNSLSIKQVWNSTFDPKKIFASNATITTTDAFENLIHKQCSFRTFFLDQAQCFVWQCVSNESYVSKLSDRYKDGLEDSALFQVPIYQSALFRIPYFWISACANGHYPRGHRVKWEASEAFNDAREYSYYFYILEKLLLPPPYPTNCRNYGKDGYQSQIHSKESCQRSLAVARTGTYLSSNIIDEPVDLPFGLANFAANRYNRTFRSIIDKIVDECDEIAAQPDCSSLSFIVTSRNPLPIPGDLSVIKMKQIVDPIYYVANKPKWTLLDVVLSTGSVLATWVGFSVVSFIPRVFNSIIRLAFITRKLHHRNHPLDHSYHARTRNARQIPSKFPRQTTRSNIYDFKFENNKLNVKLNSKNFPKNLPKNQPPLYLYHSQPTWRLNHSKNVYPWWHRRPHNKFVI